MRLRNRTRVAVLCAPLLGAVLAVPIAAAAPVAVDPGSEESIDPVAGAFALEGHGYGHGRGMSQWGAQGAATLGVPYATILSTYYPGTELVEGTKSTRLNVALTGDNDGDLRVRPMTGLELTANGRTKVLPARLSQAKVTVWRVRKDDGAFRLQGFSGGKWHTYKLGTKSALASPVKLHTDAGLVRIVTPAGTREYRGEAWAVADGNGVRGLRVVNNVRMESYLRSVVPSESFPSWEPAALRAQAVAARTYALWKVRNSHLGYADICDTTSCQVYHGRRNLDSAGNVTRNWEAPSTDAAVRFTGGRRLEYEGTPALTEFSASNGGWSTKGDKPYQVAREDPWDGVVANVAHAWSITITTAKVRRAWPSVGQVISLRVLERDGNGDWGGRVLRAEISGTDKVITVTGQAFARAMGLRHIWWRGKPDAGTPALLGAKTSPESEAGDGPNGAERPATEDTPVEESSAGAAGPEQFETRPTAPPAP